MWLASLITIAKWRSNVSFCYLPQLGFSLLSKRSDPRIGKQTFTVTNLALADPDPQLFELPGIYGCRRAPNLAAGELIFSFLLPLTTDSGEFAC
jgi:hypothetical protein